VGLQDKQQQRRKRGSELYKLFDEPYLAKCINISRRRLAGSLIETQNNPTRKKTFDIMNEGK
jgi:hypothetical protein